jgi:hypothetical protein
MNDIHICGVSRGHWAKPVPINLEWVDDDGNTIKAPQKYPCEHTDHWKWGKGTRNGQKLYYPTETMLWQKWVLTEKEWEEAVDCYDMFSIEMTGRIICKNCADQELKSKK